MKTGPRNRRQPVKRKRGLRAFVHLIWRWTVSYKNFTMRQAWPLRIVLGIAGIVLALFAAILVYEVVLFAIGLAIVCLIFLVVAGFGHLGDSGGDDEFYQMMSDAEQRQHEDEGRV